MLLHQQQGAADAVIRNHVGRRWLRLRLAGRTGLVDQHDVHRLLGARASEMPLDQICGQIGHAGPARTGDAVAVDDIELIGNRFEIREFLDEIAVMIPADAAAPPLHQPDATQHEAAGAHPNQGDAIGCGGAQISQRLVIELGAGVQQAADDDDVVEASRIGQRFPARDLDAAAGPDRIGPCPHDSPPAADLPAAVAIVGGKPQPVDESGQGGQREIVGEDEANR
jgi:hypothetical protein